MFAYFAILLLGPTSGWEPPQTRCAEVLPAVDESKDFIRSTARDRAVLLIHGLTLRPLSKDAARKAEFRDWQQSNSPLVKKLAKHADVYSFAYAQTTTADEIPEVGDLGVWIDRLRKLGYQEIVLVGYSAGGVIAREFVEDNPDSGVTKVIQVCTPNEGSVWAKIRAVRSNQADFLGSLTQTMRREMLHERANKRIPDSIEFACIAGSLSFLGDVFVPCRSQWSEDLQKQGVPVYPVGATHWHVMYDSKAMDKLVTLVEEPQPRWDATRVAETKKLLIGK
jgi:pimeloyl-ACP methyl ester carboxylesterase